MDKDGVKVREGQIWKEVDPRFERYVRIVTVLPSGRRSIGIQTCAENGKGGWAPAPRSRHSWCDRERFNGKRGGYALHREDFHDG